MKYQIKARLKEGKAKGFKEALENGTVAGIGPDGREIVKGMESATISKSGDITWNMICFCSPPLEHEREAILDEYFEDMRIEPSKKDGLLSGGVRFLDQLESLAS